jgi:hypothetical protein
MQNGEHHRNRTWRPACSTGSLVLAGAAVIKTLLEAAEHTIEEAVTAVRASQAREVAQAAHILKGSCANVETDRLRGLCQQLENLGNFRVATTRFRSVGGNERRIRPCAHGTS